MENNVQAPLSRHWLESLSTGELIKLADNYSIDIPPGLERIFIIEELLETSAAENEQADDDLEIVSSWPEPAALPKQYNISFIDVLIRDPFWVYAFWEIRGHEREIHENAPDFNGYCLRVVPLAEGEDAPKSKDNSFTVAIDINDTGLFIGFTEQSPQSRDRYIIRLGAQRGDSEIQIAISRPFNLPRLIDKESLCDPKQHPLICMSGLMELPTIRTTDRQSRIKGKK
ncbi:MAG: DUF4912 domain-containing protein [Treponema sp.]|jgi:hypothetical protein|nr:DUF4912 domain-containing protein [Treponema sp.]